VDVELTWLPPRQSAAANHAPPPAVSVKTWQGDLQRLIEGTVRIAA
jgi:hypothetical protein